MNRRKFIKSIAGVFGLLFGIGVVNKEAPATATSIFRKFEDSMILEGGSKWTESFTPPTENYISVPDSDDFKFGKGDVTISFWNGYKWNIID